MLLGLGDDEGSAEPSALYWRAAQADGNDSALPAGSSTRALSEPPAHRHLGDVDPAGVGAADADAVVTVELGAGQEPGCPGVTLLDGDGDCRRGRVCGVGGAGRRPVLPPRQSTLVRHMFHCQNGAPSATSSGLGPFSHCHSILFNWQFM